MFGFGNLLGVWEFVIDFFVFGFGNLLGEQRDEMRTDDLSRVI